MKKIITNYFYLSCIALLSGALLSCDGRNTGNVTEVDSTQFYRDSSTLILDTSEEEGQDSLTTRNAVKVDIGNTSNFDWEAFKEQIHVPDISGQSQVANRDDVATGPWNEWGDYSYQLVYRLYNDELWLQTFLRTNEDSDVSGPGHGVNVLSLDAADTVKASTLWIRMEEIALALEDSLNVSQPNPR